MALGPKNGWKLTTVWFYCFVPVITYVLFRPIIRSNIMNISLFETHIFVLRRIQCRDRIGKIPLPRFCFCPLANRRRRIWCKQSASRLGSLSSSCSRYIIIPRREGRGICHSLEECGRRVCVQCALKETPFWQRV